MSLVPLNELLADAAKRRYAVGYFESWDVYSLEAVVAAAEAEKSPVIIGIGGLSANHGWLRDRGIELYGAVARSMAQRSRVPVSVLFNEADSYVEAVSSLGAGYNAVMMHTQGWSTERLLSDTANLVAAAHAMNIEVEGEIGALAEMNDGEINDGIAQMTETADAVEFVKATGVDCLAVAVGNVHFVTSDYVPTLDIDRVKEIDDAVDVPLVLHGGSGTPNERMRAAIEAGITKVNVGTRLKHAFGAELKRRVNADVDDPNLLYGSRFSDDVCTAAAEAMGQEVVRYMRIFDSSGKAAR